MDYDKSTFCEIRGVLATVLWLDANIHLDYWSSDCGHQKVFRLRMLCTKHCFGPKAITLGIGKLVNRCFADLEVYMPNDQS